MTAHTGELGRLVAGSRWRLIHDAECGPEWNMAVDEAMLDAVALNLSPPTVRLYRWDGPSVSIGRSQKVAVTVDLPACKALGVVVVRRPTGGRAVLHGGDQCVSVVVPLRDVVSAGGGVLGSYRVLSEGIVAGLEELGLQASFAPASTGADAQADCFSSRSRSDLVMPDGQKLVGSAQRRRDGVILQQSSIRHFESAVEADLVLPGQVGPAYYPLRRVDEDTMEHSLVSGFERALGATLAPGSLSAWELERAAVLAHGCVVGTVVDTPPTV